MVGHCTQDHVKKTRQPECQLYLKPKCNQPVLQRDKYRSGVFHPSANRIPVLEVHTVQKFLAQQKRTAPGPD